MRYSTKEKINAITTRFENDSEETAEGNIYVSDTF